MAPARRLFMERNVFGRLIGGVLGLSSLGALGALGFVFGGGPTPPLPGKSEGEWRLLEPVRYENLSIFPVVSARAYDTSWFLTLDEGLASGEVQVREQGSDGMARSRDGVVRPADSNGASVNQLVLINRSKRPLLLLAGELVSGGKQDRIIGKDRLVPVGSKPLPLDVFCVEHGRWTGSSQFAAAKTIVHPSVRESAAVDQAQTKVWDSVRNGTNSKAPVSAPRAQISADNLQSAIAGNGRTEAYEKIYESRAIGVPIDNFVAEKPITDSQA